MYSEPPFPPPSSRFSQDSGAPPIPASTRSPQATYRHIVVPVDNLQQDVAAVSLALALATPGASTVTLLHLAAGPEPSAPRPQVNHCLDALGQLHAAAAASRADLQPPAGQRQQRAMEAQLRRALQQHTSEELRAKIEIRVAWVRGDFVDQVVQFCRAQPVDLLVLAHRRSRWGLPFTPAKIRKVLRQASPPAIVVHPPTARRIKPAPDRSP